MPAKYMLSFYIGGMGARNRNFHANLVSRFGYEGEVQKIQDLFAEGKRDEAAALVPDSFADGVSLVGSKERIRDRLEAWKESPVTTLLIGASDNESLRTVAELIL